MQRHEVFIVAFILGLAAITFFMGNSITGFFVHTMYCANGECKQFCSTDIDCNTGEMCCEYGFESGVCDSNAKCTGPYVPHAQSPENIPTDADQLSPRGPEILFYGSLLFLLLLIGILYFISFKKISSKVEIKKEKK